MILAQGAEVQLKKDERLNDDEPSIMQISSFPYSEIMATMAK